MGAAVPHGQSFPRAHRLGGDLAFKHVFDSRHRRESGPLLVYGCPNGLSHSRLGLSVGRRVGGAVRRTLVKRRIREAFRTRPGREIPGFDLVVVVRPHGPLRFDDYRRHLENAMGRVVNEWHHARDRSQRS